MDEIEKLHKKFVKKDKTFILVSDDHMAFSGTLGDQYVLLGCIMHVMAGNGVPKEHMLDLVETAYLNEDSMNKRKYEELRRYLGLDQMEDDE